MNLVESVFETAEKFTQNPRYVEINQQELAFAANDMKVHIPTKFPVKKEVNESKSCLLELVGNAINYCYWYGSSYVRPLDSCSGKMYDLVINAFEKYSPTGGVNSFDKCLDRLIKLLSLERFPMLEERVTHLNQLRLNGQQFIETFIKFHNTNDVNYFMNAMVQIFPGYASDIFLKRAFLFFCQLNRNFGWFEEDMKDIPVPADYQVPKMLEYYNVLDYDEDLKAAIDDEQLIPKGSYAECEIRASTIIACRQLCIQTGWTIPQVDGYFWLKRKEVSNPFHLTVTSDY